MPVDLSAQIFSSYERALARAKTYLDKGRVLEAAAAYRQCAAYLRQYAQQLYDPRIRPHWIAKAKEYEELAHQIEAGELKPSRRVAVTDKGGPEGEDDYEMLVTGLIHRSSVTWDQIGGLESVKREIKRAYGLTLAKKPRGVKLEGWRRVLFFGPPGTGKTMLAAATSNGLEATFFNVRVQDILSKYFGESNKIIQALFVTARKFAPSVVFLDDIESIMGQRGGVDSGTEARIVATLLTELDGLSSKDDPRYVLTIASTNLPWLLDKAILSRFQKRIYIPLPDQAARRCILQLHIDGKGLATRVPYEDLAVRTEGYSGREIERLCQEAIQHMIEKTNPDLVTIVDQGQEAIREYQLKTRPLEEEDWAEAFQHVKPETTQEDLKRFEEWQAGLEQEG